MKPFILLCFTICCFANITKAQTIKKAEYFFDDDPGFGKGKKIAVPSNTGMADVSFAANISSLSEGLHTFYIRSYNATGWSVTNAFTLLKQVPPPAAGNMIAGEYFFDADPGFGKATTIPGIPTGTTGFTINFSSYISTLSEGLHVLYLRTKDANNKWSITNNWLFLKQAKTITPKLVKAEYFFDIDPGFGKGKMIKLSAATDVSDKTAAINISKLDTGRHVFYLRTLDANGSWSITNVDSFMHTSGAAFISRLNLSVQAQEKDASLTWNSPDQSSGIFFNIQHSTDAVKWVNAGTMQAKEELQHSYAYLYKNLQKGYNYFRIEQVDAGSKRSFSTIKNLYYLPTKSNSIEVTPNPVVNRTLTLTGDVFRHNKTVVTIIGSNCIQYQQHHFEVQNSNMVHLNLNKLISAGMYFIEVESTSGKQTISFMAAGM